jgi:hypothetical protein
MNYTIDIPAVIDEQSAKLAARFIVSLGSSQSFATVVTLLREEGFQFTKELSENEKDTVSHSLSKLNIPFTIKVKAITPTHTIPVKEKESTVHLPTPKQEKKETISASTPVQQTRKAVSPYKIVIPLSLIITIFTVALFHIDKNRDELNLPKSDLNKQGIYKSSGAPSSEYRKAQSSGEKEAQEMLDSADLRCGNGSSDAEKFYQFAISFNPKNLDAWFGLLNCYRTIHEREKSEITVAKMKQLFGENVLEPKVFSAPYGEITQLKTATSTASLLYETESEQDKLYSDLFQLCRRFSSTGKFNSLRILAKRKDGTGMFLSMPLGGCVTYSDFLKYADIQEIE